MFLVDDDIGVRRITRRFLEEAGHTMVEAVDSRLALLLALDVVALDLILTDIILSEDGDTDAFRELRARCPRASVLAMTGGGRTGRKSLVDAAAAFDATATNAKPYKSRVLVETVNRVLADGGSPRGRRRALNCGFPDRLPDHRGFRPGGGCFLGHVLVMV